jgi:phage/plasmid-associated DNA primase
MHDAGKNYPRTAKYPDFDPDDILDFDDLADGPENKATPELLIADALLRSLPEIICQGDKWRVYEDGIWQERRLHHYQPEALSILKPKQRTERFANQVLRHIQARSQTKDDHLFVGALRYNHDGTEILLNVANGVVHLDLPHKLFGSGKPTLDPIRLEKPVSQHYFTQKLPVDFDPKAKAPTFSKALRENLPDKDDQDLWAMFHASIFVPVARWETALCCFGATGTGKSTLQEGIEAVLGDACTHLSLTELCDPGCYSAHKLEFAILNTSTELEALELNSDRWKQLVSVDLAHDNAFADEPFEIKTTCKFSFLANHIPRFKSGTDAELRRLRFLKFTQLPAKKDLILKDRIATESSGILNLLLQLVSPLLCAREGDFPSGSVQSVATSERFRLGNDPVKCFVESECILDRTKWESGGWERKSELKDRFWKFLNRNDLSEKMAEIFFKQLYDRFQVKPFRPRIEGLNARPWAVAGLELVPLEEVEKTYDEE